MKCGCTTIIVNVYNVGSDQIIDRQEVISTMSVFIIYPVPRGDDRGNVEVAGQSGASKAIKVLMIREKDTLSGGCEGKARRNLN